MAPADLHLVAALQPGQGVAQVEPRDPEGQRQSAQVFSQGQPEGRYGQGLAPRRLLHVLALRATGVHIEHVLLVEHLLDCGQRRRGAAKIHPEIPVEAGPAGRGARHQDDLDLVADARSGTLQEGPEFIAQIGFVPFRIAQREQVGHQLDAHGGAQPDHPPEANVQRRVLAPQPCALRQHPVDLRRLRYLAVTEEGLPGEVPPRDMPDGARPDAADVGQQLVPLAVDLGVSPEQRWVVHPQPGVRPGRRLVGEELHPGLRGGEANVAREGPAQPTAPPADQLSIAPLAQPVGLEPHLP